MKRRIKKFYQDVGVAERSGAFLLLLDGREAKTPAGAGLAAPRRALAEAIAAEWAGEGECVDFDDMALTRLAATAIDLGPRDRERWAKEIVDYLGSDLLCYRAEEPAALVIRQEERWAPFLAWARGALGAPLCVTTGLVAVAQPEAALAAARARADAMEDWTLIGARTATGLAGSAVLGLALEEGAFPAEEIFAASRLDERFQAERWGVDDEAREHERRLEDDFLAVARFLNLLRHSETVA
ncbi:MAG: ATP12 family chaperone protein [Amphiplicatus sp.]